MATKTRAAGPHVPPPYEIADVASIQALQRGDASEHQQKLALKWLIERAAGTYEFNFYPTDRETAFALGREFVGQQIVKLLHLDLALMRRNENVATSKRPSES